MMAALALRRARRDLGVLVVWIALVAFAIVLGVGGPRLQRDTLDASARQAVATAGSATDVLVGAHIGTALDSFVTPVDPSEILGLARAIPSRLPRPVRSVYAGSELAVVGPSTRMLSVDGVAAAGQPVNVQVDLLTPQDEKSLVYSAGAPPTASGSAWTVNVVISRATARAAGLTMGSVAQVSTIPVATAGSGARPLSLRVVGIVGRGRSESGDASPWRDTQQVWAPTKPSSADQSQPVQIAVLASSDGLATASKRYSESFSATLRIRLDPARFTQALEGEVGRSLSALATESSELSDNTPGQLSVSSDYVPALAGYPAAAGAVTAQISILAAGILGTAAALILLVSQLLVARRAGDTALERARGASLWSIGFRALGEATVLALIGAVLGLGTAATLGLLPIVQPVLVILVSVVALFAGPAQTVLAVRGLWAGRRIAANRSDRAEVDRRLRARRIAIELTLIALAIAAFVALLGRGLLETASDGVDPLLASAPLLVAIVVTIVVLRIYRWPVLLGVALGRRSTGALGLLAAVRAQRSIAVLPLLALTISVSLAVGAGLLGSTVSEGQDAASWQRIGADVRVNAPVSRAGLARVTQAPAVTGATVYSAHGQIQLRLGTGTGFATLVAVEPGFGGFLEHAPQAGIDATDAANLDRLSHTAPGSTALPVVVDAGLADRVSGSNIGIYYGLAFIPITIVGTISDVQADYLAAPFVYVDQAELAKRLGHPVPATALLVDGPGAERAVSDLGVPSAGIHSRAQWLSERQARPEVSGVASAIGFSLAAAAVLAALALIVTVLGGARERGRSLALVRTLGLPATRGWWLALAELAPVVIAALVGGVVAGVGMVVLLEPAMGLGTLTGGLGNPRPAISLPVVLALVAGTVVLLIFAVAIEVSIRRQDRLSEVLRVGETA